MNRRIVLAKRPQGAATPDCFRLEEAPIPEPQAGQVLLRTRWLSLDPYMRGRMSDAPSYAAPVAVGEVMVGGTVAVVESSRHGEFKPGDLVLVRSTPFQTEWKKDGETHYGQTFAVNELSLLTAKSEKKENQEEAAKSGSRRSH